MQKVRNAVIIIILCIIGAYKAYKPVARLILPPTDSLHDALAGSPVNASRPGLHLSNSNDDQLRDSVAGNAIPGFGHNGNGPHGNTEDGTPPPPRGGGDGGVGSIGSNNPNSQIPPGPAPLSPSSPASPYQPPR